MSLTEV